MTTFKLLLKVLAIIVIGWALLVFSAIYLFESSKNIGYQEAQAIIDNASDSQKMDIFNFCKQLMSDVPENSENVILAKESAFESVPFDFVRASKNSCGFYLYKNPGKGVGFSVTADDYSKYKFYWFNDYVSWDRYEIEI